MSKALPPAVHPVFPPPRDNTWYVYAIECEDGSVYIGQTVNLANRWKQHFSGRGARWTRLHKPVQIFYYEEAHTYKEAWHKEFDLKKHHRHMLKRILRDQKEGPKKKPVKKKMKRKTSRTRKKNPA
jgi:predicted GIY-YIG superfamily endonuclease